MGQLLFSRKGSGDEKGNLCKVGHCMRGSVCGVGAVVAEQTAGDGSTIWR